MNYDDETLMAYADGELEGSRRAEIAAAVESDPALARRVEEHRALRARVSGAFSKVLELPVPDSLAKLALPVSAPDEAPRGKVVQFPSRGARAQSAPWRTREWLAMAASLFVGAFLSWRFLAPKDPGVFVARNGALLARGELAVALDRQLASEQQGGEPVLIGLTFKSSDGGYCRSFVLRASGTAGLACHAESGWQVPVTGTADVAHGDLRQATTALPAAILEAIQARVAGEPLDAAAEKDAQLAEWNPSKSGNPPRN